MFRKYFSGQSYFSFLVKQKKYLAKNITHSFTYTEIFLGVVGLVEKKPLSTYQLMQLLFRT